jgi:hypothetical protein
MIGLSSKTKKCMKCLEKKTFSFLVDFEFFENRHKHMRVMIQRGRSIDSLPCVMTY